MRLQALLFASALLVLGQACTSKPKEVKPIDPKETYGMALNDFAVVVDVREADEIRKSGKAAPAKWLPFSKIQHGSPEWSEFKKNFPKTKQAVFYCAGGGRAQIAAEDIAKDGVQARNMGGFSDWVKAGLPTLQQ